MRRMVLAAGLLLLAQPAFADVQDYCAAYARDFADLRPKDRDIWQQRYDNANADCIEQFTGETVVAAKPMKAKKKPPAAPKPVAAPAGASTEAIPTASTSKAKPKPVASVAAAGDAPAEAAPKPQAAKPKLTAGSPEWLDYCARKYTSFNREKGTYLSKTGVERKCLVTADFK